jgi:DNA-binding MarR family transcriptional regulator
MTAIAMTAENPQMTDREQLRAMTTGLRHLLLAGERFRNNYAKELGLGSSDLVALGHVYNHGPTAPRELGAAMGMTSGTVTALLDRIEKAGFVVRSSNPEDRRSLLINVTPAGRHAMEWVYEQFDAALEQCLATTPGLPTDQLATMLEHLSQALESRGRE